jgi:hypothetical protein
MKVRLLAEKQFYDNAMRYRGEVFKLLEDHHFRGDVYRPGTKSLIARAAHEKVPDSTPVTVRGSKTDRASIPMPKKFKTANEVWAEKNREDAAAASPAPEESTGSPVATLPRTEAPATALDAQAAALAAEAQGTAAPTVPTGPKPPKRKPKDS